MFVTNNDWETLLAEEINKDYFIHLTSFLEEEEKSKTIFPPKDLWFEALRRTPFHKVKVVILGQDPYHEKNQAHGLAFSVPKGVKIPPSLVNIYKELSSDFGYAMPSHGYLGSWANEGILLLNATLTVQEGKAGSHKGKGWERFTDAIISLLNARETPIAFILWGSYAKEKTKLITNERHAVFASAHPSPLSSYRGFFGSKPFSSVNRFLKTQQLSPVDWRIPE